MVDSPSSSKQFKPFRSYSSVNKVVMGLVICFIALLGMLFFIGALRKGLGRMGSEELFLAIGGMAFLFLAWHVTRFIVSPRFLIEQDYFLVSDFYRKRKLRYEEILALAEFERMMPIRYNRKRCLRIPVLAIRLRSRKLIQFALPIARDNRACLDALRNASGITIESLGVDPPNVKAWRLEA